MSLTIAERWFETRRIDDDITLLWEPHVVPLLRCNIWHVRGRDRDLLVDTGMGIASLRHAARQLLEKSVLAVATHTHLDHVGGHHEFAERLVHRLEADNLSEPGRLATLSTADWAAEEVAMMRNAGYEVPGALITALPHAGYKLSDYRRLPAAPTVIVEEGDVVDLGDRQFDVCICRAIRRAASGCGNRRREPCFRGMPSMMGLCSISFRAPTSRTICVR